MPKDKIIFHISYRLRDPLSGSQVHPLNMMKEFEQLGAELLKIENTKSYAMGKPRALARTFKEFGSGVWKVITGRYLFCFSETAHAPLNALERILYRLIKIKRIPLFIYLRDAQWLVPRGTPTEHKQLVERHRRDIDYYNKVPDMMFVPSTSLAEAVGLKRFTRLPPGAPEVEQYGSFSNQSVIYVGGGGKTYDLDFLLEALKLLKKSHPGFTCTLVTRPKEISLELSGQFAETNTSIGEAHGAALADHYSRASIAVMPLDPGGYANLSMPVKLFEYIAYGLPVVSRSLREPAVFIRENNCGVIADTPEEFAEAIRRLLTDQTYYETLHANALKTGGENTWRQRANSVYQVAVKPKS
jgi:glycosyltransferase involved in cell wall biosynthesis